MWIRVLENETRVENLTTSYIKFGLRCSQWHDCYLKISMAKQLLLLWTFVVPSGHCDRKMGDSSTPYDQFISVYMPLLKQKYPNMKNGKF